ncbi:G-type lectin S-receptor-like serine/threonine-protein kinase At4g03230 [Durio zibethinus]|uniref:G-type lectin S-receptor-like serine/threonine-protein kinase At4g03230 n=1 Tax=Durio zibethinus TaxID=66656 RepID=A0A6P6AGI9_DURZI|nr:G-type lectin S-receptor-like serine/threonine-protein kinase At4g03230 [Durio zibethinus]
MKMDEKLALISWTSEEDPAPRNFTFQQDLKGKNQLVVMERSIPYWRSSGAESGKIFKSKEMPSLIVNFLSFTEKNPELYNDTRMVINFTGDLQYWKFDTDKKNWSLIWWEPKDNCSKFNFCGNFGTCSRNNKLPCKCLPGFKPKFLDKWNAGDFSGGCSRNDTSCGDDFLSLKRMKVEYSGLPYEAKDEQDCREECLLGCQCQAYSVVAQRGFTNSCLTWRGDLENLQEDQDDGYDLYVRVSRSDIESTVRNCETCGTNLVPYPLSTGPKCGDPMYSSFYCNNNTEQLCFMAPGGNYNVISVNREAQQFVIRIQADEANNCGAMHSSGNKNLQLSESSAFSLTSMYSSYRGNFTANSSLIGVVEVEITWKPPLEPTCNSSVDCKDWPHSTCNKRGNGPKRCLCNANFRWNGSALNCTQEEHFNKNKPLPLILGVSVPIAMGFLCAVVSIYMWRTKMVKRRAKQRKAALHRYDTERGVKELMESSHFEEKDGTGIDVPFFEFESILAATDNFSEENKLGKGGFGPVY